MPFPVRSYRAAVWFRALSKSTHVDVDVSLRGDPIIGHNEYIDLVRNRQVLYSITKHAMRRSADEIGATSISFRPKVFSDATSVVDGIFSAHRVLHDKNQPRSRRLRACIEGMMNALGVGEWLAEIRKSYSLLGVVEGTIQNYEHGRNEPNITRL